MALETTTGSKRMGCWRVRGMGNAQCTPKWRTWSRAGRRALLPARIWRLSARGTALAALASKPRHRSRSRLFNFKLTLVCTDPDTLWGVCEYLTRSGATLSSTSRLEYASEEATEADAIVLFADDYPYDEVVKTIAALSSGLVVVVTGRAGDFSVLRGRPDLRTRVIVLSRPTWGWMLLDAVRTGTTADPEGP